jgi:pimeloyl-ACP methyl ester carboxylesterase
VRALRLGLFALVMIPLVTWLLAPVAMAYFLMRPQAHALVVTLARLPFPAEAVAWRAPDGRTMRGWLARAAAQAPVILLGHGRFTTREAMVDHATFLYKAGYSVLLFDWRGWGESEGDLTTFGLREAGDVSAALDYLAARPDLDHPRFGGLGVSMGSGMMLTAAAGDPRIAAVVCDSIYTYDGIAAYLDGWTRDGLPIGPIHVPIAPLLLPTANLLLEGRLADLDPVRLAPRLSPRPLLLIHAEHDDYPLTPVAGARAVFAAAHEPKTLWISPVGTHATVLSADPAGYQQRVLAFFATYLRNSDQ